MKLFALFFLAGVGLACAQRPSINSNLQCDFCISSIDLLRSDATLLDKANVDVPQVMINLMESDRSAENLCMLFEKCEATTLVDESDKQMLDKDMIYFNILKFGRNRRIMKRVAKHAGKEIGNALMCHMCNCC